LCWSICLSLQDVLYELVALVEQQGCRLHSDHYVTNMKRQGVCYLASDAVNILAVNNSSILNLPQRRALVASLSVRSDHY